MRDPIKKREYDKIYRKANRLKDLENAKRWRQDNPDHCKQYRLKRAKKRSETYKEWYKVNGKKSYDKKKESGAHYAKSRIGWLVSSGKIQSLKKNFIKCTDCPNRAEVYDHRDYNKPQDVQPVCRSCNVKRGPAIPLEVPRAN